MIEEIDKAISDLDERIAWLTSATPPVDAGFLISARAILVHLRRDCEDGCSREHLRAQLEKLWAICGSVEERLKDDQLGK